MPGVLLGTGGMSANKTWLQILQRVPSGGVDRTPSNNQRQSAVIRMDRTLCNTKGLGRSGGGQRPQTLEA